MQQPYETNPNCKYQDSIPLEREEKKRLKFWKIITMTPIALISVWLFYLLTQLYPLREIQTLSWDLLFYPLTIYLFIISTYNLFYIEKYKEIFESELEDEFGVFFVSTFWFKDYIGKITSYPFYYKTSRFKNGKRYRVHKLPNKSIILKIEEI